MRCCVVQTKLPEAAAADDDGAENMSKDDVHVLGFVRAACCGDAADKDPCMVALVELS